MAADRVLVEHVASTTGLSRPEAARVVEDVLAFHAVPVQEYVVARHAQMKNRGARNAEIFALIAAELPERVVAAPHLTERQLRRLVYG